MNKIKIFIVLFAVLFFGFVSGQKDATASSADKNPYKPFLSLTDFVVESFKNEIRLELALKLVSAIDLPLSGIVRDLKNYRNDLDSRALAFDAALSQWQEVSVKYSGVEPHHPSTQELEQIAKAYRSLNMSFLRYEDLIRIYNSDLDRLSKIQAQAIGFFSIMETAKLDRSKSDEAQWRKFRLLEAFDEVQSQVKVHIPKFFEIKSFKLAPTYKLLDALVQSMNEFSKKRAKMKYDFSKETKADFEKLKSTIGRLDQNLKTLKANKNLISIIDSSFFKNEKKSIGELLSKLNDVKSQIEAVSDNFLKLASDSLEAASGVRRQVGKGMAKSPGEPLTISRQQFESASLDHKRFLIFSLRIDALGLTAQSQMRHELQSKMEEERLAWLRISQPINSQNEQSNEAQNSRVSESAKAFLKHQEWLQLKKSITVDFALGLKKLIPGMENAVKEGRAEEAALIYLAIQGTKKLVEEIPEAERGRSLRSAIALADQALGQMSAPIQESLTTQQQIELWYVFGESPIFNFNSRVSFGEDLK